MCEVTPLWVNGFATSAPFLRQYSPEGVLFRNLAAPRVYGDIAMGPTGTLYGIQAVGTPSVNTLYELGVGPATVTVTEVRSVPVTSSLFLNGLAVLPNGQLVASGNDSSGVGRLISIDPATGVATPIGPALPAASIGDVVVLPDGDMLVTINLDTTRDALVRVHPAGTQTAIGTVPTSFGLALSGGQVYLAGAGGVVWKLPTIPVASSTAALPLVFAFDTMSAIFGATSPLASNCALRTPTANPDNADTTGSAVTVQPLANDIPGDPAAPLDAATLRLLPPSEAPPPWWSSPVKAHSPSI